MKIIRAARKSHFTQVPNETARDKALSFRARGLLLYLLSHDDGWSTSADRLRHEATEGRDAINTALRELVTFGYLVRTRKQDAKGRWDWAHYIYDTPQPIDTEGDSQGSKKAPKQPVEKSPKASRRESPKPLSLVENSTSAQVRPQTGNPHAGFQETANPTLEHRASVNPGLEAQERIPRPLLEPQEEKTNKNPPPPTPSSHTHGHTNSPLKMEEGVDSIEGTVSAIHPEWDAFAGSLPPEVCPRSQAQWVALVDAVEPYLRGGWKGADLAQAVCAASLPPAIASPAGFLRQRLAGLARTPQGGRASGASRDGWPVWCGTCDERTRIAEDGDRVRRCPTCHPKSVASA